MNSILLLCVVGATSTRACPFLFEGAMLTVTGTRPAEIQKLGN